MDKEKNYLITDPIPKGNKNANIIAFSKPLSFEDETFHGIDLGCLDDATGEDLCAVSKEFNKTGNVAPVKEMDPEFCMLMTARVAEIPIELLKKLPMKDAASVARRVQAYFFGEE